MNYFIFFSYVFWYHKLNIQVFNNNNINKHNAELRGTTPDANIPKFL